MPERFVPRVTSPCDQRWSDLSPRGEGRYCGKCDTTVIDLSRLTRREALERTRGGACVRARLDERGEPIFRPDPERRLGRRVLGVLAALSGGCASAAAEPAAPHAETTSEAPLEVPLVPSMEALAPADVVELSAGVEQDVHEEAQVVPTDEQRALTRRKRERRRAAATPVPRPPRFEMMGGLPPHGF